MFSLMTNESELWRVKLKVFHQTCEWCSIGLYQVISLIPLSNNDQRLLIKTFPHCLSKRELHASPPLALLPRVLCVTSPVRLFLKCRTHLSRIVDNWKHAVGVVMNHWIRSKPYLSALTRQSLTDSGWNNITHILGKWHITVAQ